MNNNTVDRRLVIGIAVLGVLCAAMICLSGGVPAAALTFRQFIGLRMSESSPPTTDGGHIIKSGSETPVPAQALEPSPKASDTQAAPPVALSPNASPTLTTQRALESPYLIPREISHTPVIFATPEQIITASGIDAWCAPWNSPTSRADVLSAIDGVTIAVQVDGRLEKVRYIGVDLLEFGADEAKWKAMTQKNRELVEGKSALLIEGSLGSDLRQEDEVLLRYVMVGSTFVNLEMIKSGFAIAKSTPPYTSCDASFQEAETRAILGGKGLWAPETTATRTLRPPTATVSAVGGVIVVKVEPRGSIWQEPEEYVEIYNSGADPVQLAGWSVSDMQNHIFVFPKFVLGAGEYCRVTTNEYRPQNCGFSYYWPSPIWDNTGDCAYLKDASGRLVDKFCYD